MESFKALLFRIELLCSGKVDEEPTWKSLASVLSVGCGPKPLHIPMAHFLNSECSLNCWTCKHIYLLDVLLASRPVSYSSDMDV